MALGETAELAIRINLEGNASAGVSRLTKQLGGLQQSVGRVGKGVGQLGAGFVRAGLVVGGFAIAGITAAGKAAVDFEDAFAGVRKTVNEADLTKAGLSFESLAKDFREMATETPLAATEFARLGEIAGALGVKAKDITSFAEVTAKLGVTTNLTADAAADAFGRIGTILDLTGKDYEELADSVVALGNAGASTESEIVEITKRFAATAKQAGLTKEQMVGLASATASLGFEPERGGSALARVFANMATNIATANEKGTALSKGLGRSIKSLQRDIDQGKGLGIFLDLLEEVRDMSPTAAARFLKNIGVTNVSDRTIFLAMSQQLPFVNEQLEIAKNAQGALLAEAEKKFATTASKIQIFKNNLIESGIAMGEQFLPAVRRALDQLTGALKDPGTKADIVQLGKDIGAAIDDVEWDKVLAGARDFVDVLKTTLSITLSILATLNKLPTEIKAAALGLLALNKASGGLIGSGLGNIAGGIGESVVRGLGSKLPKVGSLFAQPVFVTNWPLGGIGGGVGGGLGTAGGAAGLARLFPPALIATAIIAAAVPIGEAFADALPPWLKGPEGKGKSESQTRLENAGARNSGRPMRVEVINKGIFDRQLDGAGQRKPEMVITGHRDSMEKQYNAIERLRVAIPDNIKPLAQSSMDAKIIAAAQARTAIETKANNLTGFRQTQSSVSSGSSRIVGAIRANRPQTFVNVNISATTVKKTVTVTNRYGQSGGSADRDSRYGSQPI